MQRTRRVPIYVDDDELRRIRIAAAHAGLSMSDFGRQAIMAQIEVQEQSSENRQKANNPSS